MNNKKLFEILLCPVCKTSGLNVAKEAFLCKNSDCIKSQNPFHIVNSKPVLINFEESVIDEDSFINNTGKSIVKRRNSYITKLFRFIFKGQNKQTIKNFSDLKRKMLSLSEPKILIIGGGQIGSGLNDFYLNLKKDIIAFDIYDSDNVDFISDAHYIPIVENYFDLVIIQAVLEHVLNPNHVVSEIHKVLKKDGMVYAETPFMQHVHEGPFDFTRYTESGHRFLFRNFKQVSSGYISGLGSSLIWSLDFFFSGLFRSRFAGKISRIIFFWLRFIDNIIPDSFNIDGACGVYFIGQKSDYIMSGKEIIKYYQGNQKLKK
jgi:SAM-dependent methyltransferase